MRRSTRWAVGAAAATVIPALAAAAPAAAATASNTASASVDYDSTGRGTVECTLTAHHQVDTAADQLITTFSLGGSFCQGTIATTIRYVDDDGQAARTDASAHGAVDQSVTVYGVGGTAATVDYSVTFDDCQDLCFHTLQTRTK
jgi:hypothetical protein